MLTPHHLSSLFSSSFVYTPAYTCSHTLTSEHDPHHYDVDTTIQSVVKNHESLTLKQMFDVTAQLVNNQEEIHGLDKIQWEKDSWKRLSLIGDETVIDLQSTKVYVFLGFFVLSREDLFNILILTKLGRTKLQGSNLEKAHKRLLC